MGGPGRAASGSGTESVGVSISARERQLATDIPWFRDEVLTEADRRRLRQLVDQAHAQGRRIRFWGVQDQPFAWRELHAAGVDLINTDRLADLRAFLLNPKPVRGE